MATILEAIKALTDDDFDAESGKAQLVDGTFRFVISKKGQPAYVLLPYETYASLNTAQSGPTLADAFRGASERPGLEDIGDIDFELPSREPEETNRRVPAFDD